MTPSSTTGRHLDDLVAVVDAGRRGARRPSEVVVELDPQREQRLVVDEVDQPARARAGRRTKLKSLAGLRIVTRSLRNETWIGGVVEQHPAVPAELRLALEEARRRAALLAQRDRQGEVGGAEADAEQHLVAAAPGRTAAAGRAGRAGAARHDAPVGSARPAARTRCGVTLRSFSRVSSSSRSGVESLDDPGAGAQPRAPVAAEDRAQDERGVDRAAGVDGQHRAAVDAARLGLEVGGSARRPRPSGCPRR